MNNLKKRILDIEVLRGPSLLIVIFYHFFIRFPIYYTNYIPNLTKFYAFDFGGLGISIFLLISGYFMIQAKIISIKVFLLKRIFRLRPIYFIAIFICLKNAMRETIYARYKI